MTAKVTPPKPKTKEKTEKPKEKKKKGGRYKLKLKGWLKTPADWERFNAWAKINSLPRKIPEPEPVIRTSKPLWKMKKRIDILSKPVEKPDLSELSRLDQSVSKKALKAKASKRIKIIAQPVIKPIEMPREFPLKIRKATLNYKPTDNIIKISQPKDFRTEECKDLAETLRAKQTEMEEMDEEAKKKHQRELWGVIKKAMACPDLLSAEQIAQLITEGGVYRTAFAYEPTPWMKFLSLPSYRFLRAREDDTAKEWKEYYLSEVETRGKQALKEQFEREEKRRKLEEEAAAEAESKTDEEIHVQQQPEATALQSESPAPEPDDEVQEDVPTPTETVETEAVVEEPEDDSEEQEPIEDENEEVEEEIVDENAEPVAPAEEAARKDEESVENETAKPKAQLKPKETKPKQTRFIPRPTPLADDEESKKKRAERNAWRFEPPPWKDGDPLKVKESALKGPVSPRMAELAQAHIHKDTITRKNPFDVKKSALKGPVPGRMTELAKPNHPREPVQKPPKREINKYGQPIFPVPPYGKKLPPVPPYKEKDCKPADEETPKEVENAEKTEEKPDPIVFKPTIDPYFDPEGAERQLNARNAMKNKKEEIKDSENSENQS
ncbi:triadin [Diachasma alloeum]|uniref:triadin n=1 Tax=Diachasma alloeum TaxID=454923 RepID=UPI00073817A5|nr:triadin [Diachasma alloeum]